MSRLHHERILVPFSLIGSAILSLLGCGGQTGDDGVRTAAAVSSGSSYQLVRRGSNKCLASTGNFARLQQLGCANSGDQTFKVEDAGGGNVRLVSDASGQCVDVSGSGTANGTQVQLWECNGTSAQSFRLTDLGDGYTRVTNTNSNKCLDVNGNSAADGAKVQIWSCNTTDAQKWKFTPPSGGDNPGGSCGTAGGVRYVEAYRSALSRWCIDESVFAQHAADFTKFYGFGDSVISTLQTLFAHSPAGLPFTFQATKPTGGASTGSDFGLGDTVTGDAFWNNYFDNVAKKNVVGFWGYLLALHEAINVWTGTVSSDWPTDWWADHRSPFPNSMDYHVMQVIGTDRNDANLIAAATAQHNRFGIPNASEYDSEVVMFDQLFAQYNGFNGFANVMKLVLADGMHWGSIGTNPSALHSEYVIAFLQLGLGVTSDLTQSLFAASGVGKLDTSVPMYTVSSANVRNIGTSHCSIAAARTDPAIAQSTINSALAKLRSGNFAGARIASRACAQDSQCPGECRCDGAATHQCIARW
jgi:hypothetical protein